MTPPVRSRRIRRPARLPPADDALRLLAEHVDEVFWIVDGAGRENLYVSPAYERVWGRPRAELRGDAFAFTRAMHPDDRDRVVAELRAAMGTRARHQYRIIRPDGGVRWIEARSFPIQGGDGRLDRIAGVAEDITERKLLELRERAGARVAEALERADDTEEYLGRVVDVARGLLGWEVGEAWLEDAGTLRLAAARTAGAPSLEAFTAASRGRGRGIGEGLVGRVCARGAGEWRPDGEGLLASPREADAREAGLVAAAGIPLVGGERVLGVLAFFSRRSSTPDAALLRILEEVGHQAGHGLVHLRTRTALRNAENQVRQVQKVESLGQMAGMVAHDFNNLLTPILGYADLLLADPATGEAARRGLGAIQHAAEEAAALTRQLLAFARRQPVAPVALDLNEVIRGMEDMLRHAVGRGIVPELRLAAAVDRVRADRIQVSQVLLNLAVNARDAMDGSGPLIVHTRAIALAAALHGAVEPVPAGRYVLLEVADRGAGMDALTRARIFEPFFTTKADGAGTGLGLATVFSIVKGAGGFVDVDSAPGAGATFRCFFPALPGIPAAGEPTAEA